MATDEQVPAELHGPRVRLVPLAEGHLEAVRRWRSDPEVTRYWITQAVPSMDELQGWLERNRQPGSLLWLIEDEQGAPIGHISLFGIDPTHRHAELALMIGERRVWNRGYAREALRVLLGHAFAEREDGGLRLHKVWLTVAAENLAAQRVYLACDFHEEGALREHMYRDGSWHDEVVMSILDREWAARGA